MELYQKETNAVWYTDKKLKCEVCGKRSKTVIEILTPEEDYKALVCWHNKKDCGRKQLEKMFFKSDELLIRMIEFDGLTVKEKRHTGLSLRHKVLARDGFKCKSCGATAEDSKLEIDHIIPYVEGGKTEEGNLQTLCFECNRGKRDNIW